MDIDEPYIPPSWDSLQGFLPTNREEDSNISLDSMSDKFVSHEPNYFFKEILTPGDFAIQRETVSGTLQLKLEEPNTELQAAAVIAGSQLFSEHFITLPLKSQVTQSDESDTLSLYTPHDSIFSSLPPRVRTDRSGKVVENLYDIYHLKERPEFLYIGDSTAKNVFPEGLADFDKYTVSIGYTPGGNFDECVKNVEMLAGSIQCLRDGVKKYVIFMAINCDVIVKDMWKKWKVNPNIKQAINGLNWGKRKIENIFSDLGIKNITVIFTIPFITDLKRYRSRDHKIIPSYDVNDPNDLETLRELETLAVALETIQLQWSSQVSSISVQIWDLQSVLSDMSKTRKLIGVSVTNWDCMGSIKPFQFENQHWSTDGLHLNKNAAKVIWSKLLCLANEKS
ncbi:unnamed protein product [Rotaria magnacalcarata]|uniref:Uncharacterized protein n=1 Tax=Rotaria magnacalcarata TaxID=392030 RepID=A0A820CXS7_9BILA|nr:unnamed protein product [Rotaria magnacalcarata]CAF4229126.1 unnamed protein product [Rotaria magnacalcarata]